MKTQHEKQTHFSQNLEEAKSHLCGILLQTIQAPCRSEIGLQPSTWSVNGTQIMRTNSCYMNNESNPFYLHIGYLNFYLTFSSWVSACGGKRKSTNGILLLYEEALLITILFHFCCSHKVYLLYHPSLIVPEDSNLGQKTSD